MNTVWDALGLWPVRALVAGGAVLLVGRLAIALTRQPARRVWVGTAAVVAALFAIPLSLIPGWVPLPVPAPAVAAGPSATDDSTPPDGSPAPVDVPAGAVDAVAATAIPPVDPPVEALSPVSVVEEAGPTVDTGERPTAEPAPAPAASPEPPAPATDWVVPAAWAYGLVVSAFLIRLALGHLALARLWRGAHPVPEWAAAVFRRLAGPVCPRAELRASARPVGPVCFGVVRPRVLIPAGLLATGDGPALRAVLAHELAHLGRRDPLAGWLLGLARAAYFVCPWVAGLRREVRLAQECLADADAARQAAGPADYAELLIRLARSRPAPLGAVGARGPSSELYRRVTMLLQRTDGVEPRCPRRWALAAGAGLTALAVLAAGLSVQPRPAAAAEPKKAAPVEKDAPKKDAPADPLKEALDQLKKDLKDDPAAVKMLEDLLRETQKAVPPAPPAPPRPGIPRVQPLDADREIDELQDLLRQQMEMLQKQLQGAGGLRGGFVLGPDGLRPLPGVGATRGGARLGVRVERPAEVLASQLDLPPGQGLVCVDVPAESVAGKAGIRPHDVLLELGGKPVPSDFPEFQKVLAEVKPDAAVDIVVMRKGKKETIKGVKLPEARPVADVPAPILPALPNFDVVPLPPPGVPPADPRFLPGRGGRAGVTVGPGETARVEQVNDAFTVFYTKGNVKITIAGTKDGATAKAESIEVDDNGKTHKAESIDKLPKEYQDLAKNALKAVK